MQGEPEGTWNLEKLHLELKYLGRKLADAKLGDGGKKSWVPTEVRHRNKIDASSCWQLQLFQLFIGYISLFNYHPNFYV